MRRCASVVAASALSLALAAPARADVERFALLLGNNIGASDEPRLRFAERDAGKLARVLRDLGGFRAENVVVMRGAKADDARRALIAINARIRSLPKRDRALLVVYYSGHATARTLHLGSSKIPLRELEQLVRGSSAAFRLLILDACRSGALTRVKGGKARPPLSITLEQRLSSEGAVFLTSSAASEDAQESDRLRGSFFTHYLVTGLLGAADANGDGKVVLDEAYRYAYQHTLRASSRTLAGTQHPTYRYELRGQGQIVLTQPRARNAKARALLTLPRGHAYLVMQRDRNGAVVAEIGVYDRVRQISLRPGRYFVRARGRDALLEGSVTLRAASRHQLDRRALRRTVYARLVRKGGTDRSLAHGPLVGYTLRSALPNGDGVCNGGFLGYNVTLRLLSVQARLGACGARFGGGVGIEGESSAFDLELRAVHAWDIRRLTLAVGVAAGAALLHQRFETRGAAASRLSFAAQVGAVGVASVDLWRGIYLVADVAAQTYFFTLEKPRELGVPAQSSLRAAFAVRASFGVGKHF